MAERTTTDWRVLHGALFVILMIGTLLVPVFRQWPWVWLAPLAFYFLVALCIAPMRRSLDWLRIGRITPKTVGASVALIVLSSVALLFFHRAMQGEVRPPAPLKVFGAGVASGIAFALLNATLEELVFRGILFDALESQWGKWMALFVTAAAFGVGHLHGYPPGRSGALLAGIYGLALGGLRLWTGGLALPILVHIASDATIYRLLMRDESPT